MLRVHTVDVVGELPNPDSQVSKRAWEAQAMSCRQKLRQMQDARGGASTSETDSSDSCDDAQLLIDDEGDVFFQDTLKDSLAEEVASFLQEFDSNNIRKIDAMFKCPFCPFRSFQRLQQLRDHITVRHSKRKQSVCSGTKQV